MPEVKPRTTAKATGYKPVNQSKIKVANTEIIIGDTYEIIGKLDRLAPDGMQRKNTTKFLHEGNGENRGIPFIDETRKWDTGFEEFSLCNLDLLENEKTATVKNFNKLIREPYEKDFQVDCSATNHDFWRTYTYELYTNKTFNTENPKDLFDLFHALKQGRVCEVGEKDSTLQKANYCVRNVSVTKSVEDQKIEEKYEAIAKFAVMLDALDPVKDDTLYSILEWLQVTGIRNAEKDTVRKMINKMFESPQGYDFARRFLEALKMSETDQGKTQMQYFSVLQKLNLKNKLEFKRQAYYFDGTLVGNNLKEGSLRAINDAEFKNMLDKAYEKYLL